LKCRLLLLLFFVVVVVEIDDAEELDRSPDVVEVAQENRILGGQQHE